MATYKTPLRYPGGKQKIWRFIAETIYANGLQGGHYIEPYAGGSGVAIELLLSNTVSKIHLNDSCPAVYAFWHSVVNNPDEICRRIRNASLNVDEWRRQKEVYKNPNAHEKIDLGFALFFLNRCNRSGILTGGVIGGLNQSGPWKMDARFSRNELINRIERIAAQKQHIKVRNLDAEKYLLRYVSKLPAESIVYCDPPYFNKADRLYANYYTPADHAQLAKIIQEQVAAKWIVSYDNAPAILEHYADRRKFTYDLQYNAASAYKGTEVFIFCDKLTIPRNSEVSAIDLSLCQMRVACNY